MRSQCCLLCSAITDRLSNAHAACSIHPTCLLLHAALCMLHLVASRMLCCCMLHVVQGHHVACGRRLGRTVPKRARHRDGRVASCAHRLARALIRRRSQARAPQSRGCVRTGQQCCGAGMVSMNTSGTETCRAEAGGCRRDLMAHVSCGHLGTSGVCF